MNQKQQNRLSASLFRQLMLLNMLNYEYQYFSGFKMPSGIKNILFRAKNIYTSIITDLKLHMPNSHKQIDQQIIHSDEKIRAISTILEKLAVMDEEDVLRIEADFEIVKVQY